MEKPKVSKDPLWVLYIVYYYSKERNIFFLSTCQISFKEYNISYKRTQINQTSNRGIE